MTRCVAVLSVLLTAVILVPSLAENHVVELTSDNFESQTQIGTGATTGDWLIRFYAPWCGHCKKMTEEWQKLAQNQHDAKTSGDIGAPVANIGNVNCDDHRDVCKRFDVKGYPTISFFKQGVMYEYMGARTVPEFEKFINGGYKKSNKKIAPKPPGVANAFQDELKALAIDVEKVFSDNSIAALSILVAGFIAGLAVSTLIFISSSKSRRHSVHKAKKIN